MRITLYNPRLFVILFFALFFLIGLFVFTDYGLSWDEAHSREVGVLNWNYAVRGDTEILFSPLHQNYGPAFSLLLVFFEKMLGLGSEQHIFYFYHLATFLLFFAGVFVFYLLCLRRFKNEWFALFGGLFLVLSPRIFGESFYNPKDIPLLATFIFSVFTLVHFLEKPSFSRAIAHAAVSAFAIDTRLQGLTIIGLTLLFSVSDVLFLSLAWQEWKKRLRILLLYLLSCAGFIVLFWPLLWENPVLYFMQAIKNTSRYVYEGHLQLLYFGEFVRADSVPWHYIPVWILITTPIIYTLYFLLGIGRIVGDFFKNGKAFYKEHRLDLLFLSWFFFPILAVILIQSVLYDGWRLLYFIYPAFILVGLVGLQSAWRFFIKEPQGILRTVGIYGIIGITVLNLFFVSYFMIKNHPYQHLYFNELVGSMEDARTNFDMDYWGLTFREGLEYIARTDTKDEIPITFLYSNWSIISILPEADRARFKVFKDHKDATYILNNYRFQKYDSLPHEQEIYAVTVGGTKVMSIFKKE